MWFFRFHQRSSYKLSCIRKADLTLNYLPGDTRSVVVVGKSRVQSQRVSGEVLPQHGPASGLITTRDPACAGRPQKRIRTSCIERATAGRQRPGCVQARQEPFCKRPVAAKGSVPFSLLLPFYRPVAANGGVPFFCPWPFTERFSSFVDSVRG